jgi:hypothetical protein
LPGEKWQRHDGSRQQSLNHGVQHLDCGQHPGFVLTCFPHGVLRRSSAPVVCTAQGPALAKCNRFGASRFALHLGTR